MCTSENQNRSLSSMIAALYTQWDTPVIIWGFEWEYIMSTQEESRESRYSLQGSRISRAYTISIIWQMFGCTSELLFGAIVRDAMSRQNEQRTRSNNRKYVKYVAEVEMVLIRDPAVVQNETKQVLSFFIVYTNQALRAS